MPIIHSIKPLTVSMIILMAGNSLPSVAELIKIPVGSQQQRLDLPKRGETKQQVVHRFGKAERINAAVGQPPISRWHYSDFSVYFEGNTVIHSVHHHKAKTTLTNQH